MKPLRDAEQSLVEAHPRLNHQREQVGGFREGALDLTPPLPDALLEPQARRHVADRGEHKACQWGRSQVAHAEWQGDAEAQADDRQEGGEAVAQRLKSGRGQVARVPGLAQLLAHLDGGARGKSRDGTQK